MPGSGSHPNKSFRVTLTLGKGRHQLMFPHTIFAVTENEVPKETEREFASALEDGFELIIMGTELMP